MVEASCPSGASLVGARRGRLPIRAVLVVLTVEAVAALLVVSSIAAPTLGEFTLAAFLTLLSLSLIHI